MRNPLRCTNPDQRFKPQWADSIPAGYRAELFLIPFSFTVPGDGSIIRGVPWSLDDDVPYLLRALFFPQLGNWPTVPGSNSPGYCRIWDTQGNPLSLGLVFAFGMMGIAGLTFDPTANVQETFAWGFPFEPFIFCDPGGTLAFDFQLDTNAIVAAFQLAVGGSFITFTAGVYGTSGNGRTITLVAPGSANSPLSIAVVGNAVTINLATNGASAIVSTVNDVANLINSSAAAVGVMGASVFGAGTDVFAGGSGPHTLTGGVASSPIVLNGTMIGQKLFKDC
jgi:hypothetical protein